MNGKSGWATGGEDFDSGAGARSVFDTSFSLDSAERPCQRIAISAVSPSGMTPGVTTNRLISSVPKSAAASHAGDWRGDASEPEGRSLKGWLSMFACE
jgi:hypothetical protein